MLVGSDVSVKSAGFFSGRMSVLAFVELGSSLSLSSFARLDSSVSMAQSSLGNTLSVTSEAHQTSSNSICTVCSFVSEASFLDWSLEKWGELLNLHLE